MAITCDDSILIALIPMGLCATADLTNIRSDLTAQQHSNDQFRSGNLYYVDLHQLNGPLGKVIYYI